MSQDTLSINAGLINFTPRQIDKKKNPEDADLRAVAEQFEAMFVYEMMKSSRAAKLFDDPLNTSASEPFLEMMDREISQKVSDKSSLGIAEAILSQFNRK
jgi:flagellar protein FlgJ